MCYSGQFTERYRRATAALFEIDSLDVDDCLLILKRLSEKSLLHIIVIDGIDECPKSERDIILQGFKGLMFSTGFIIKVFLFSRQEIGRELDKNRILYSQRTMSCPEVYADITDYIRSSVADRLARDEISSGEPNCVLEIIDVLIKGAHGM